MEKQKLRRYSDIPRALDSVYLHKVLHDRGLMHLYDNLSRPDYVGEENECEMDIIVNALFNLSEAIWGHYSQYDCIETIYFSHPDIMEYYNLCRVYGKSRGVKLRDNPYMTMAERYVRGMLQQNGCFTCSYHLQTKVNHRWASGIVFRMAPEFEGHLALLVLMTQVFDFYSTELEKLKTAIQKINQQLQNQPKEAA